MSDGMKVSHKVKAFILVSTLCPVLHSAQIGSQCQVTGGFDAGKHSLLGGIFSDNLAHFGHIPLLKINIRYSNTVISIVQGLLFFPEHIQNVMRRANQILTFTNGKVIF